MGTCRELATNAIISKLILHTQNGSTPLMVASHENQLEVARVLINEGAIVNYQNNVCNY